MKKISLWFVTFVIIGMLLGMFYSFVIQKIWRNDNSSLLPIPGMSGSIQLGSLITPSSEVVGGVALDPYRDNTVSGEQRLYKSIPIMPAVEINLDCSTADTEASRLQCEKFKTNIERAQEEREKNLQQSGSVSTGRTSTGSTTSMTSF